MGNARDSVKAVAKAVAPSNEEDGVAVILEQLADAHESAA
jgi:hydroxymethylpyrimidine pyrophosphatase-like HAD family hydrolase